jgi:outer membrane protein assembly factor BamE (lipoprotein component of BamABCDE complex)
MKRKIIFTIIGLFIFLVCFMASVKLRDYFYETQLRNNIQKIKIGMSEQEVIEILGKPSNRFSSDSPTNYWCYDTDSIAQTLEEQSEMRCGNILIEMSFYKDGKVIKVHDF